jgi:hypothetical protein
MFPVIIYEYIKINDIMEQSPALVSHLGASTGDSASRIRLSAAGLSLPGPESVWSWWSRLGEAGGLHRRYWQIATGCHRMASVFPTAVGELAVGKDARTMRPRSSHTRDCPLLRRPDGAQRKGSMRLIMVHHEFQQAIFPHSATLSRQAGGRASPREYLRGFLRGSPTWGGAACHFQSAPRGPYGVPE